MAKPAAKGNNGNGKGKKINPAFAANLRHYWPFDEGTGQTSAEYIDFLKNYGQRKFVARHPGGAVADARPVVLWNGTCTYGLNFRGPGLNHVQGTLPSTGGENVGTRFTVGAWARPTNFAIGRTIIAKGLNGDRNFDLQIHTDGTILMYFWYTATLNRLAQGASVVPSGPGPLSLIVGTYDGATLKVYLNGRLDGSLATTDTPVLPATNITVGAIGSGLQLWLGPITRPFIMNRTMSAGEVLRLALNPDLFTEDTSQTPVELSPPIAEAAPPGGTGSTSGGSGSLLGGVTQAGSMKYGGAIIGGHTPQDGFYHQPAT